MTSPADRAISAWWRFWFQPQATSTLAIFRIGFGLVATAWTATLAPNLFAFYGRDGILPHAGDTGPASWGLPEIWDSSAAIVILFVLTLAAAICLTLGLFSRLAAIVLFVGIMSFLQRNTPVTNSGDGLVRNLAFFCALTPCGESLSLDRLRKKPENFWEFPARPPWGLRLVQIQLSLGYLSAVWHKSGNPLWREGTAVSYALRMQDAHRLPTPAFITHSVVLTELLTYGTLASELALGTLIWNRTVRPWVLLVGISLHLSIDIAILVGFFSYALFAAYLAFIPPQTSTRRILATRDRIRRRRLRNEASEVQAPEEPDQLPAWQSAELLNDSDLLSSGQNDQHY
ncbi:MAG: hypothetical protein JWN96_4115 [Mycobacterium sp.]|nr:hypothetical protein [Mycobacterium sp.]